jgi:hypothetical protein
VAASSNGGTVEQVNWEPYLRFRYWGFYLQDEILGAFDSLIQSHRVSSGKATLVDHDQINSLHAPVISAV